MSKRHHCPHLVPLLGYCTEKTILVYEYMDRGSLLEHLGTQKPALTWKQRIGICIAAARGLRYLHELQIIHGNVKSSNILLNEKWVAKITDLSIYSTELLRYLTVVRGTLGANPKQQSRVTALPVARRCSRLATRLSLSCPTT